MASEPRSGSTKVTAGGAIAEPAVYIVSKITSLEEVQHWSKKMPIIAFIF